MKYYTIVILLLFLFGCSPSNDSVIQKADSEDPPNTKNESTELVEKDKTLVIPAFNKNVQINLDDIPILEQYLNGFPNPNDKMEEMNLIPLPINNESLYLLEFACSRDLCSYMLINEESISSSFLVTDLAKYKQTILSPNETKMILQFSRNYSKNEEQHHIALVNMETFERIIPEENKKRSTLNYTRPFKSIEWLDEQTISITTSSMEEVELKTINEADDVITYTFHIP
ncbi:hypothetical protein D8M04_09900 [Oceanobacillus piezotolerans]|uniref:Lipoprotein n=1 Tax=Oceanobacillus piezotolerans TaxID=2448030 RepID=A0A498DDV7_9BACI|nr:hypothetical protein [Oceanobacillus piezotolerans]RLL45164.1 hypothetical protein D8M04_09900 [Oceanobacillus piezotolerans]